MRVVDDGYFFEVQEHYAKNIVVGFARLNGKSVGIVANQPAFLAGIPRHQRFGERRALCALLRFFNIPLVTFEDVPGFLPGTTQEYGGIIKHGAKLLFALCRSDGARSHGDHAQSLWRRLLRDGVKAHPHRCELCVADR